MRWLNSYSFEPDRSRSRARRVSTATIAALGWCAALSPALAQVPNVEGRWSDAYNWPSIPIHAALLPDGKVATFGATPQNWQGGLTVDLWDPRLGVGNESHVTLPNGIPVDSFCAGQVLEAWSGELMMVGGSSNAADTNTLKTLSFSYKTKQLKQLQNVAFPRWYSTTTTLPDGRIIVNGGVKPYSNSADATTIAELYTPGIGWAPLYGTAQPRQAADDRERRYWYPHVFPTADQKVFVIAGKAMYRLGYAGNGSVGDFQAFNGMNWGSTSSAVLYAPNKVLQFGGGISSNDDMTAPPGSKNASVIDFSTYPYKVTDVGQMAFGRHWVTGTVLPNGEVLATGGAEGNNTLANVAYQAETWSPATGQWRKGASMKTPRLYHSTALLLPDGRVLVGGGGAPGPVVGNSVEIYSPSYLFGPDGKLAERPVIGSEPGIVRLGQTINVAATGTRPITRFTLVKTGAVTHSFNTDQRFLDVPFAKAGNGYWLTITGKELEATPGYYMLFALNDQGVPSVAKMIRIPSPIANNGEAPPTGQTGETKSETKVDINTLAGGNTPTTPTTAAKVPADGTGTPLIASHSNLCLSVEGRSNADGAKVVQAACDGSLAQKWTWRAGNGGSMLVNGQTNKCLDLYNARPEDGAVLVQWPCWNGDNQIWKPTQTATGMSLVSKVTGKCVDVSGASTAAGAPVWQWTCNTLANQAWQTAPRWSMPVEGSSSSIVATHSNLCLSVEGRSNADGAKVVQAACDGSLVQKWTWRAGNGGSMLVNGQSNKCLDVYNLKGEDGATLVQWSCWNGDNQIWKPTLTNKGLTLTSKLTSKCVDVSNVSTAAGAQVWQWTCNAQDNQNWQTR